jgi:hypothetical protein
VQQNKNLRKYEWLRQQEEARFAPTTARVEIASEQSPIETINDDDSEPDYS